MTGFVYFIQAGAGGPIKIGYTSNAPQKRMVKIQTDCPWAVRLLGAVEGTEADEKAFHDRFAHLRNRGEWFDPCTELTFAIEEILASGNRYTPRGRQPKHDHPLCKYRAQTKISLDVIANQLGLAKGTLSRIESGKLLPSIELTAKLSQATGIHAREFRPDIAKMFGGAQ